MDGTFAMLTRLIPPPVALVIAIGLTYAFARLAPGATVDWAWLPWLGGLLIAAGLGLMLASVWTLWREHTTVNPLHPERARHLVTDGIYWISRNPIYLGDALLLAGVICWLGQPVGVLFLALFVVYIDRFQIREEERALEKRFGKAYEAYRERTCRWI